MVMFVAQILNVLIKLLLKSDKIKLILILTISFNSLSNYEIKTIKSEKLNDSINIFIKTPNEEIKTLLNKEQIPLINVQDRDLKIEAKNDNICISYNNDFYETFDIDIDNIGNLFIKKAKLESNLNLEGANINFVGEQISCKNLFAVANSIFIEKNCKIKVKEAEFYADILKNLGEITSQFCNILAKFNNEGKIWGENLTINTQNLKLNGQIMVSSAKNIMNNNGIINAGSLSLFLNDFNNYGIIIARDNIFLKANKFENVRLGPFDKHIETINYKNKKSKGSCRISKDVEKNFPALLISTQGKIVIDSPIILNEASIILAQDNIDLNFLLFSNKIHNLVYRGCRTESWFSEDCYPSKGFCWISVNQKFQSKATPTTRSLETTPSIVASTNSSINLTFQEKKCSDNSLSCKFMHQNKIINQGIIYTGDQIELESDKISSLINGPAFSTQTIIMPSNQDFYRKSGLGLLDNLLAVPFDYSDIKKDLDYLNTLKHNLAGRILYINAPNLDFINQGSMQFNKIDLKINKFKNLNALDSKQIQIRTPISGVVLGIDIEMNLLENFLNSGGKIIALHKLFLYSKTGNIENRTLIGEHKLYWSQEKWQKFATSTSTHSFFPGVIMGQNVEIETSGFIINEASKILSEKQTSLKAYLGVISEGLAKKNFQKSYKESFFSFEKILQEIPVFQESEISTNGDLIIISNEDNIIKGTNIKAKKAIFKSSKNNEFLPTKVKVNEKKQKDSLALFSYNSESSTASTDHLFRTNLDIDKLFMEGQNNIFDSVLMQNKSKKIYLNAFQNNIFKGTSQETRKSIQKTSLGLNFLVSDALKALYNEQYSQVLHDLILQEELLEGSLDFLIDQAIKKNIINKKNRKKFKFWIKNSLKNQNYKTFKSNTLHFFDFQQNINPNIIFSLTFLNKSISHITHTHTFLSSKDVEIYSGQDLILSDGSRIIGDHIDLTIGENLKLTHKKDTLQEKFEQEKIFLGLTILNPQFSIGLETATKNKFQETHQNAILQAPNTSIQSKNIDIEGGTIRGENVSINNNATIKIKSVPDKKSSKESFNHFGFMQFYELFFKDKNQESLDIKEPSNIKAKHLDLTTQKLILNGAFISTTNPDSHLKTESINYDSIELYNSEKKVYLEIDIFINLNKKEPKISISPSIDFAQIHTKNLLSPAISQNINLATSQHLPDLHKDLSKKSDLFSQNHEKYTKKFKIVIPKLNLIKIFQLFGSQESLNQFQNDSEPKISNENIIIDNLIYNQTFQGEIPAWLWDFALEAILINKNQILQWLSLETKDS